MTVSKCLPTPLNFENLCLAEAKLQSETSAKRNLCEVKPLRSETSAKEALTIDFFVKANFWLDLRISLTFM